MSWIATAVIGGAVIGGYSSNRAAKKGAAAQLEANRDSIAAQNEATKLIRGDLQPFKKAGANQLNRLTASAITMPTKTSVRFDPKSDDRLQSFLEPESQAEFLKSDPLYKAISDDTERRLNARAAASGKLHSGGTAKALQDNLYLLGRDRVNDRLQQLAMGFSADGDMLNRQSTIERQDLALKNARYNNLFNLATMGQNAAAQQGTATQNAADSIAQFNSNMGDSIAARYAVQGQAMQSIGNSLGQAAMGYNYFKK